MKNLAENIVLYVEGKKSEKYTQQVIDNYTKIHDQYFNWYNKLFLPINRLTDIQETVNKGFENNLRYNYPYLSESDIQKEIQLFKELYNTISENASTSLLFINNSDYPYLMDVSGRNKTLYYSEDYYSGFINWIYEYVRPKNTIYEDLADSPPPRGKYDPDEDDKYKSIAWEVQTKIERLSQVGAYKLLAETLMVLAKKCGLEEPKINQIINSSKFLVPKTQNNAEHLSKVIIDSNFRIVLSDYNNLEIKMPTLSKVVFIFFLRHPEGILFKEIKDHWWEIHSIYHKVTNRSSTDTLTQSLNDLLNPISNSLNEKCSRLKEAFVSVIGDDLAKYYYVTGERGRLKSIKLPRELVAFEE